MALHTLAVFAQCHKITLDLFLVYINLKKKKKGHCATVMADCELHFQAGARVRLTLVFI